MAEKKFEIALKELEDIIEKLEDTDIPLDDSISLYERGVALTKICSKKLKEAHIKIEKLTKDLNE